MIVEKILGTYSGGTAKPVDYVHLEWFECGRKHLKKTSDSGEEIGIKTETPLKDGDILYEDADRLIVVKLDESELIKIAVRDICEMGRLCFEIGNRHLSILIQPDTVKIPYDEPTLEYLKKLGFAAEKVCDTFTGFTECRAHHHHG